jgi:nucleoside-diphosphate-sugar epimerase
MTRADNYVTGAGGFLGRHLIARLIGPTLALAHHRICKIQLRPYRSFFHLAAYGNLASQRTDTPALLHGNILKLAHIIEQSLAFDIDEFIFVSTSSVMLPVQTPYARMKLAAEQMLLAYPRLPVCIVRPFSITGIGEQPEHLIPKLIRSCMEQKPMNLVLQATHDYVDVEDVARAIITLGQFQKVSGVFELGSGIATSNEAVLNLVETACGCKANVTIVEQMRNYDSLNWCCQNPATAESGWMPRKSLAQSIREMVQAYRNEHP